MVTYIIFLIQPYTVVKCGARCHLLGEPTDQHGGYMATPRLWSWEGLYTTYSDARKHYVTCYKEKFVLGASVYRYRTVYSFNTIILVVVMFVSLFYSKLNQ